MPNSRRFPAICVGKPTPSCYPVGLTPYRPFDPFQTRERAYLMSYKRPDSDTVADPKTRKCLACQRPFASEWVGERICRKCKSSSSWRMAPSRQYAGLK